MGARSLFPAGPERVELRGRATPPPDAAGARVDTLFSAVSPGTELLVHRFLAHRDGLSDAPDAYEPLSERSDDAV